MKKRTIWITITNILAVILILAVGSMVYAARYASSIAVSQQHTAAGAIKVTETPIPTITTSTLQPFQIVSAQTTASYSVFEDLIFQHKPNNDAIGTIHAVTGHFQIQTGASPLVTGMNIKKELWKIP